MTQLLRSTYPPLVQGLHTSFLSYLRTEVASSRYVAGTQGQQLLERIDSMGADRHARRVADDLLFAINDSWVERKKMSVGVDSVAAEYFPGSRLFENFPGARDPSEELVDETTRVRQADSKKILTEVDHYDPEANRVLEIRCHPDAFDIISLFMIHQDVRVLGLSMYHNEGAEITVRIPSFTLLEASLRYCLDQNALRPCYVPGEISSTKVNELHKSGFHPVGMPLKPAPMHGRMAPPAEWPWHDWHHLIHASINMPFWVQRTSAIFFETIWARHTKILTGFVASMEDVERTRDLDLRRHEDNHIVEVIGRILRTVAGAHGQEAADSLQNDFLNRVHRFFRGYKVGKKPLSEDTHYQALIRSLTNLSPTDV